MSIKTLAVILAASLLSLVEVSASDVDPTRTLDEWSVGKTLMGAEVNLETVRGQVVMITYWSARNDEGALAKLSSLYSRHGRDGFIMVGAEMFESELAAVEQAAKENGVKFTVTKGARGPVSISGFPHTFIFGRRGQLRFSGATDDPAVETVLKAELAKLSALPKMVTEEDKKEAGRVIIAERTWTNREGKDVVASVIDVKKGYVLFRLENGKELSYKIENLSADDQKLVRDTIMRQRRDE